MQLWKLWVVSIWRFNIISWTLKAAIDATNQHGKFKFPVSDWISQRGLFERVPEPALGLLQFCALHHHHHQIPNHISLQKVHCGFEILKGKVNFGCSQSIGATWHYRPGMRISQNVTHCRPLTKNCNFRLMDGNVWHFVRSACRADNAKWRQ